MPTKTKIKIRRPRPRTTRPKHWIEHAGSLSPQQGAALRAAQDAHDHAMGLLRKAVDTLDKRLWDNLADVFSETTKPGKP